MYYFETRSCTLVTTCPHGNRWQIRLFQIYNTICRTCSSIHLSFLVVDIVPATHSLMRSLGGVYQPTPTLTLLHENIPYSIVSATPSFQEHVHINTASSRLKASRTRKEKPACNLREGTSSYYWLIFSIHESISLSTFKTYSLHYSKGIKTFHQFSVHPAFTALVKTKSFHQRPVRQRYTQSTHISQQLHSPPMPSAFLSLPILLLPRELPSRRSRRQARRSAWESTRWRQWSSLRRHTRRRRSTIPRTARRRSRRETWRRCGEGCWWWVIVEHLSRLRWRLLLVILRLVLRETAVGDCAGGGGRWEMVESSCGSWWCAVAVAHGCRRGAVAGCRWAWRWGISLISSSTTSIRGWRLRCLSLLLWSNSIRRRTISIHR